MGEKVKEIFEWSGDIDRERSTDTYHILLAEDDREMRALLARVMRLSGYVVTECTDGWHLLSKIGSFFLSSDRLCVDLIISDIRMPGVSGMDILVGTQKNEGFPPVILITAFPDEDVEELSRRLGAVAIFAKPFDIDDLLDAVRQVIPPEIMWKIEEVDHD